MSEIPVRSRPRKLVDWINPTGARKVHSLIDKVYQRMNLEIDFAIRIWPTLILSVGPPPFPRFWPFYRTVLAVKGPLRRLYLRALDGSGPFSNTFPSRGKGGGSMASTVLRRVNDLRWARPSIKVGQVELSNPASKSSHTKRLQEY